MIIPVYLYPVIDYGLQQEVVRRFELSFSIEGYCKSLLAEVSKKCVSFIANVGLNGFS